jgi:hypothetical protein
MYTLTEAEFCQEAEPILNRVFVDWDPFVQPFSSTITERKIIYPCHGSFDEAIPLEVLISAASAVGDEGCYISSIYTSEDVPGHCFVSLSEMLAGYANSERDDQMIGIRLGMDIYELDSIIFSAQGRWGIMMSHERHGLLGGSPEFMAIIAAAVPNLDTQVYGWFKRFQDFKASGMELTLGWLPTLLTHVYGEEMAQRLLREADLP